MKYTALYFVLYLRLKKATYTMPGAALPPDGLVSIIFIIIVISYYISIYHQIFRVAQL